MWELQRGYGNQGVTAVPKAQINHDAPVLCTDFSSDGTKVFSGGASKQARGLVAFRPWLTAASAFKATRVVPHPFHTRVLFRKIIRYCCTGGQRL